METGNEQWKSSISLTVRAVCKGKVYTNMSVILSGSWEMSTENFARENKQATLERYLAEMTLK